MLTLKFTPYITPKRLVCKLLKALKLAKTSNN